MQTPETRVEEMVEAALDILHESIQHTPLKLSETNGTDYDRGYIFYQDMVVRDVLDNTPKLKALLHTLDTAAYERGREDKRREISTYIINRMNLGMNAKETLSIIAEALTPDDKIN